MMKTKSNKNIKDIYRLIDTCDYIIFDVFDTLVTRPFLSPKDLFYYLELTYNLPRFHKIRIDAEKIARQGKPEITLDDIYLNIPSELKYIKNKEISAELALCKRIEQTYTIYKYAQLKQKNIYFASDMYLDSTTISDILTKNGYICNNNLFLSSVSKKTKHSGDLYDEIISKLKLKIKEKVLMIGDNFHSDFLIPQRKGFKAFHLYNQWIAPPKFCNHLCKTQFLYSSISPIVKLITNPSVNQDNYWERIGYQLAGPIVYSFAKFILRTAKHFCKTDEKTIHLLLTGRDGYLLSKCITILDNNIKHSYIFAPRIFLRQMLDQKTNKNQCSCKHILDNYSKYLNKFITSESKIFVVDTRTASFSAQSLIEQSLGKSVTGIYWQAIRDHSTPSLFNYIEYKNVPLDIKVWRLFEYLVTSPEPPCIGIDNNLNPVYKQLTREEQTQKEIFQFIEKGCMRFINNITQAFPQPLPPPEVTYFSIVRYINSFINHPEKEDLINFSHTKIAADPQHLDYKPFLSSSFNPRRIKSSIELASQCEWMTPFQSTLVHITHPIQIRKIKKNKLLLATILPKLKRTPLKLEITLFKFKLILSIGRLDSFYLYQTSINL